MKKLFVNRAKKYPIREFFESNREKLFLELKTPEDTLCTELIDVDVHRPGLALAGFTEVFSYQRLEVIGTSEWSYLEMVGAEKRKSIFKALADFRSPGWVITHNFPIHNELKEMCLEQNVPLFVSSMATMEFCTKTQHTLEEWFSPYCTVHGTLVDVNGVGILYMGDSGVGKSECALDLIERGHRLVADDVVHLTRAGSNLIGRGNLSLGHHMEIRGVGIVDVGALFGIRAVRDKKKVEIVVELQRWQEGKSFDRTGLEELKMDFMGVVLPKKIIPIFPGKNITVISEVIAMNMLLKMNGVDIPKLFNEKLINQMKKRNVFRAHGLPSTDVVE